MSTVNSQSFDEKTLKIRKNILGDLREYYGDWSEWEDVSGDLVSYAIFYDHACDKLLKAAILYGYDIEQFATEFLLAATDAVLDKTRLQKHHYSLLRLYAIDRVVVGLLINGEPDYSSLRDASDYHVAHLKEYGYSDESDVVKELDNETILSTLLPQLIVKKIQNFDNTDIIECLDSQIKSREKIWMLGWRLLLRIYGKDASDLQADWNEFLGEWKSCLIKMNFHGFNNSLFILLYFLYCQKSSQAFDIKDLSRQVLGF